ncbi:MAG: diguanylate cyclase, partial [Pseudomonadota bacterium]
MRAIISCRVSRPIMLAALCTVIIVDAIILIPASQRFYAEGVARAEAAAEAALWMAVDVSRGSPKDPIDRVTLQRAAARAALHTPLLGGEISFDDGRLIAFATPAMAGGDTQLEVTRWTRAVHGFPFDIDAVIDVSGVAEEANERTLWLAAVTLLFSLVVMVATLAVIYVLILRRVLKVQQRLRAAANDPANPERHIAPVTGNDEVDDLVDASNQLLSRSGEQIRALSNFNAELESRVAQRTAALQSLTDRLRAEIDERTAADKKAVDLTAFVQKNPEPSLRIASHDRVVYANPTAEKILATLDAGIGASAPSQWREALFATRTDADRPDIRAEAGGRHYILRFSPGEDGAIVNVYGRDVTNETRAQSAAVRAATHDPLTDLPNRSMFMAQLLAMTAQAESGRARVALVTIGLKSFASLTERFGFNCGDAALGDIGERLRAVARPQDALARIAGDEFAYATLVADLDAAGAAVARIAAIFEAPVPLGEEDVPLAAAIGVGYLDDVTPTAAEMALQQSGQAMLRAKGGV